MKYAKQYQSNHNYQIRYQKSKDKDRYFRQHETEFLLHNGAKNILKQRGISPHCIDLSQLQNDYKIPLSQKHALQAQFKSILYTNTINIFPISGRSLFSKQFLSRISPSIIWSAFIKWKYSNTQATYNISYYKTPKKCLLSMLFSFLLWKYIHTNSPLHSFDRLPSKSTSEIVKTCYSEGSFSKLTTRISFGNRIQKYYFSNA